MAHAPADEKLENVISKRKHAEEINKVLFYIANAVNTTLNLDDLYRSIHQSLSRIIDVTNFFIAIVDSKNKTLFFPYHVDEKDDDFGPITDFNTNNSLTGKVVVERKPIFMKKEVLRERDRRNAVWGPLPMVWLGVPLIIKDTVIGVMAVQSYTDLKRFNNQDLQVLTAVSDQTAIAIDRKRSDDELRRSEQRFRQLFEQSNDAIIIHRKGHIIDANKRACEMLGYSTARLHTMSIADLESKKEQTDAKNRVAKVVSGQSVCFESEWKRADGTYIPIEISARVADKAKGVIQVIARDISQRKRTEEEKIRIEKLQSIGILSAGIAHDFNNLLSVILGNISLAQNDIGPHDHSWSLLKAAEEACLRSKDLTRQLITFSTGGAPVKKQGHIDDLIQATVTAISGGTIASGGLEIASNLWPVECDPEQIGHALSNVIKNAVEATPHGGFLKIKAENFLSPGPSGDRNIDKNIDKYVRITVTDHGIGIPAENRVKIFDPYFSTKQRGKRKGMGLGLTIANSIIEKHNGYIRVDSTVAQGTTVHLYLPAATTTKPPPPVPAGKCRPKPVATSVKSVLMMDDEKMIRELGQLMLEHIGYTAAFAENGERAIALFKKALSEGKPFDAIILDLTIKHGINGVQTLKKLLDIAPDTRAIVSSGYSEDSVMTSPQTYGFLASLPKPYTSVELKNVLSEVLGLSGKQDEGI